MNTDLAEAVKEAQEALANVTSADLECSTTSVVACVMALRALLAATEPAPEPVSNAYTLPEEVEAIIRSVAEHDCRCSLFADIGIFCDPCRARAFLAARRAARQTGHKCGPIVRIVLPLPTDYPEPSR